MDANDVIKFWFKEISPTQWWIKDSNLDHTILDRFSAIHNSAARCELYTWRVTAQGRLAEIIILDQFSRNMYRQDVRSFQFDTLALALAQEAISQEMDRILPTDQKPFLYMPFMHSESAVIHEIAIELFSQPGLEHNLEFELKHKAIIDRFGRYPHRNIILGRDSTEEERDFLKQPDSTF